MPRAVTPSGGGSGDAAAWVIPGAAAAGLVAGGALWVSGGLASMVAGAGWHSAHFGAPFGLSLLIGVASDGTGPYWPGADPRLVAGLAVALAAVVLLPLGVLVLRRYLNAPAADDPSRSLARGVHLQTMLRRQAATRALRLRPSLAGTKPADLPAGDVGLLLGRLGPKPRSAELFCSWEDVAVAIMAPRSGKTTTLAVPVTLAAPGAVVLTSNKTEGWKETTALRAAQTGQTVWTFDPQRIAHTPQTWWWNPLRDLRSVAEANRLAGHFVATVEDDRRDIWGPAAKELLATLLLAAAVGGRSLVDVYEWLANEATPVPGGLLRESGYDLLARTLRGTQDSPPETRGSVYFTARAATACLRDPQITAWVTPPANSDNHPNGAVGANGPDGAAGSLVEFRPEDFPTSRQTLYLLSKDEGGSAGPLVAALTDRVLRCGVAAAERRGGRLDPPMVLVLDEAANICRISDLPSLYSHLGSRGIIPLTILQSYSQAVGVWGETGTKALWGAATVKLIGAGIDDPAFAEDLSRLVGDHDVLTVSRSSGGGRGGSSRTSATRQQRILPANAIRELPKGRALLLATGSKPAILTLQPWYHGPRAAEIAAAEHTARASITARAGARDAQLDTTQPNSAQPIPPQPPGPHTGSETEALA
jgi:type IV secretory pathway TraG/TraD family ATPase VirD4